MMRITGQIVRLIGISIEVLGLLAQRFRTQTNEAGVPLPGNFSSRQVWFVVGIGFVIWMIGTALIYAPRLHRQRRTESGDRHELRL